MKRTITTVLALTCFCSCHSPRTSNPRWQSFSLQNESDVAVGIVCTVGGREIGHHLSPGASATEGFAPYNTTEPTQVRATLHDGKKTKLAATFNAAKHYPSVPPNTKEVRTAIVLTKDRRIELRYVIYPENGDKRVIRVPAKKTQQEKEGPNESN